MPLSKGTLLGPYEVLAPLGAGGMGEVYRARDTRLDRSVAIKVLPAHLAGDPTLKQRFEREARAVASLNHPNICTLYDIGSQDGIDFLVMESLEGRTLAQRLEDGLIPLEQALTFAIQIADALGKAHGQGVVHRDIKPGNVMLTKSGAKLLDFGLAKPTAANAAAAVSTTLTRGSPLTVRGTIVGTFGYMAPEQLEGKEADTRSDIFAFGVVLYEMVTGHRAFPGDTQFTVANSILSKDPEPASSLGPATPALDHLIVACLAKNPDERFQSALDAKLALKWIAETPAAAPSQRPRWRRTKPMAWIAAAIVILSLAEVWFLRSRPQSVARPTRFAISLGGRKNLAVDGSLTLAISEDGRQLAYVAAESGVSSLYVRQLDRFEPASVPDSEGATFPFFSPDGQWVGFFSQGRLKKAPSTGGSPVIICELQILMGAAWLGDDTIVAAVRGGTGLVRMPAAGGEPKDIRVKEGKLDPSAARPFPIPGNKDWVGFASLTSAAQILAVNIGSGETKLLVSNAHAAQFAQDHLVYHTGGSVWALPMNPRTLTATGPAVEVVGSVAERNFMPQFAVSPAGVLVYAPGAAENQSRNLFLVDRNGTAKRVNLPAEDYVDPAVAPDGKHFAIVVRRVGEQALAVYDLQRGVLMRLPASGRRDAAPVWTPDGKYLVFDARSISGKPTLYRMPPDGNTPANQLAELPGSGHVTSIAGTGLASVMVNDPANSADLWLLPVGNGGNGKLEPFRRTPAAERQGSLSPDGQWIAYASNDSGRSEVYVAPVHGRSRSQISAEGGEQPRWGRTGREIFYRVGSKMMAVAVLERPGFVAQRPVELFDQPFDLGGSVPGYDVFPDGKTFVMTRAERANPTEIRVIINWQDLQRTQK